MNGRSNRVAFNPDRAGQGAESARKSASREVAEIEKAMQAQKGEVVTPILLEQIDPNPYQYRKHFSVSTIAELAESIREVGIYQPIVVRSVGERFELVSGERRVRAARMVGLAHAPALVRYYSDKEMARYCLIENLAREDTTDYEAGIGLKRYLELSPGVNRTAVAEEMGVSRETLYRLLSFEKLPPYVLEELDKDPTLFGGNAAKALCAAIGQLQTLKVKEEWIEEELRALLLEREHGSIRQGEMADLLLLRLTPSSSSSSPVKEGKQPLSEIKIGSSHLRLFGSKGKLSVVGVPTLSDQGRQELAVRVQDTIAAYLQEIGE